MRNSTVVIIGVGILYPNMVFTRFRLRQQLRRIHVLVFTVVSVHEIYRTGFILHNGKKE